MLILMCFLSIISQQLVLLEDENKSNPKLKETELITNIRSKNIDKIKLLLENYQNVNECDTLGISPLMYAINEQNIDIIKLLLEFKADVNYKTPAKRTPLMIATQIGNVDIVKLLIEKKASIKTEIPLIFIAIEHKKKDMIDLYLPNTDINTVTQYDNLLTISIIAQDVDIFKKILSKTKNLVNKKSPGGLYPLLLAISLGNIEIIKLLLESGANINIKNENGETPLNMAIIQGGNPELIDLLLKFKANPNIQGYYNMSALMIATQYKRPHIIKKILPISDIYLKNNMGETALFYSIYDKECFVLLINEYKNIKNIKNNNKNSLFYKLIDFGDFEILKLYPKNEIDYEEVDNAGNNLFLVAIRRGNIDIISYLLDLPLKFNHINNLGYNALFSAIEFNNMDIIRLLFSKGFKDDFIFNNKTLFQNATETQNDRLIYLLKHLEENQK